MKLCENRYGTLPIAIGTVPVPYLPNRLRFLLPVGLKDGFMNSLPVQLVEVIHLSSCHFNADPDPTC